MKVLLLAPKRARSGSPLADLRRPIADLLDSRGHELHVHFPSDQSRYLDGILACGPLIIPWPAATPYETVLVAYAAAFL